MLSRVTKYTGSTCEGYRYVVILRLSPKEHSSRTFFMTFVLRDIISESDATMTLKCADYINNKDADSHVNVYVSASVQGTGQRFATRDTIWIEKPHLEVKVR